MAETIASTPVRRPASRRAVAVTAAGALVALAADLTLDPVHTHVPLCPFRALTGWNCPLCGGLRAVYELAHLNPGAALRYNAVVVLAAPLAVAAWTVWAARAWARRPAPRWLRRVAGRGIVWTGTPRTGIPAAGIPRAGVTPPTALAVVLAVLAVAFTLVRNLT